MTPGQMSHRLRRMATRLPSEADRALRELAQATYRDALTLSSGRVRQAVFDAPLGATTTASGRKLTLHRHGMASGLGHPYGRGAVGSLGPRGAIPYGDPAVVNAQSGDFFRAWQVAPGLGRAADRRSVAGGRFWVLFNDSPEARFLVDGTTRMISRPILDRLRVRAQAKAHAYATEAIRNATR